METIVFAIGISTVSHTTISWSDPFYDLWADSVSFSLLVNLCIIILFVDKSVGVVN